LQSIDPMRRIRTISVLTALFVATPLPGLIQGIAAKRDRPLASRLPFIYHRIVCRMFGIRIEQVGTPVAQGPCLMVANHVSWLDIPILSALFPAVFIAKREVDGWPIFGWLARLQRTLFVDRERRHATADFTAQMLIRFERGQHLILFPEGTSSDGNRVLPFKTALFGALEGLQDAAHDFAPVPVQPVSIAYTKLHGLPMTRRQRPRFAWYGDMAIVPHIWRAMNAGPLDVRIQFHEPITADRFAGRKELARHAEDKVREGVVLALAGRPAPQ
jgi:1-acyl-sn-glycerol-3-phosphate acyltransferase